MRKVIFITNQALAHSFVLALLFLPMLWISGGLDAPLLENPSHPNQHAWSGGRR